MNVPELRECAKLLHSVGILEQEKDIKVALCKIFS